MFFSINEEETKVKDDLCTEVVNSLLRIVCNLIWDFLDQERELFWVFPSPGLVTYFIIWFYCLTIAFEIDLIYFVGISVKCLMWYYFKMHWNFNKRICHTTLCTILILPPLISRKQRKDHWLICCTYKGCNFLTYSF